MEDNSLLGGNANYIHYDKDGEGDTLNLKEDQASGLVRNIKSKFEDAKLARRPHEDRMITAYNNYRGIYGKTERFREHEKSRVFVKVTKTKVLAAYGQLLDILLGGEKFPLGIYATEMPEGTYEYEHTPSPMPTLTPGLDLPDVGYVGDDKVLPPGSTFTSLKKIFGFGKANDDVLTPGSTNDPEAAQRATAKEAARRMEKIIQDQLGEAKARTELCNSVFEGVLFGTGIVKGPFTHYKTLNAWHKTPDGKREYDYRLVKVPKSTFVSVWDAYPDPNAFCMGDCQFFIERHRLNESQFRALSKQPLFDKEAIKKCLELGPNYVKESYETLLKVGEEGVGKDQADRYEVLEYWGIMDAKDLKDINIKVPKSASDLDEIQINAWICGNEILRVVINPFKPQRIPYQAFCYEKNPYSFFGIGVPENMDDSQQVINAHARMAIDNLALSGSVIFDVDETALVDGQTMEIYPGKVFRRQTGAPGQAIYGINIPNTTQQNLNMVDRFRQFADESTGLPSYSHGQTGVQSMTRTASGMSMLLGAASLNIKTVIKSIDSDLLEPLGWGYFNWNMQFYEGDLLDGIDLEVRAMGTTSIMQKEVRSQRLTMLLQTVLNPTLAPYVKLPTLIKELAHSLELDPEELLNNPDEIKIAAAILGAQNGQPTSGGTPGLNQQPQNMGTPDGSPGAGVPQAGPAEAGNGNIAPGAVQFPGEESFSG